MKRHLSSRFAISLALLISLVCRAFAASPNVARELGNAFADAVERVMPSVVVVRTEATVYHAARDLFFGQIYGIPERLAGQGSGVILSKDGYVLTSDHVIRNAEQIEVVLHDGTKFPADLVGHDPMSDLAVLKIRAPTGASFKAIVPGDSDKIRVGEFAIAIGSPFSLNSSVTVGIVSQKGRSVGLLPYEDFIQTDASINPGNSGGPLTDVEGQMIGINAIIQTGGPYSEGNIGIGFAVPANLAMRVAESLIRSGKVERPWLGLNLRSLDKTVEVDAGVLVGEVFRDTPAIRCGLAQGDIIVKIDGQPVYETRDVQRLVFKHRVGDTVKLEVRRDGKKILFEIVTERMPEIGQTMP
jgi:serine protease Do